MAEAEVKESEPDKIILHTYPLVKVRIHFRSKNYASHICNHLPRIKQHTDMSEEMRTDCIELSITACEKHSHNYEVHMRGGVA